MHIFNSRTDLSRHLESVGGSPNTIGFVPTMGALHAGHLSLLKRSISDNQVTVISVFVNPTQFNDPEDLAKYPRTLESDVAKIEALNTAIIVYAPTVEDIYEGHAISQHFDFAGLENQMEGKFRPRHFDGVGTVVKRLFEIVRPGKAYFGEKDFQQLQIVRKLVEKYNLPVAIIGCPILREENGLAMSSRNERLTTELRKKAAVIYKTLQAAKQQFETESPQAVIAFVENTFNANPDFSLEYFEIADEETLRSAIQKDKNRKYRAFIAVFANNVRLIDTISLN
jgi:pantoate--beta-alanine ligase